MTTKTHTKIAKRYTTPCLPDHLGDMVHYPESGSGTRAARLGTASLNLPNLTS